jgi:WD40 repeat protein
MPRDAAWMAESKCHILALHEEPSEQVNRDIQLFFESRFHAIREKHRLPQSWPGAMTIQALVESSCGLFIWASTACRFIEEEGAQRPEDRISILFDRNESLANLRPSLDQIYDTVLQNFIPKHESDVKSLRNALGYIVVLRTALSIEALAALLELSSEELRMTLAGLQPIIRLSDHPSTPICLHHPTFREFLLEKSRCSVQCLWIDEKEIHGALADSCVEHMSRMLPVYLESFQLAQSLPNGSKSRHRVPQVSPSLRYACLYWIEHYRQSRIQLRDGDHAHRFFKTFSNEWVQVMVLMQKGSEIGALVRMYHSLLIVSIAAWMLLCPQLTIKQPALNVCQLQFVKSARQQIVALQPSKKWVPTQHHLTFPLSQRPAQLSNERALSSSWVAGPGDIGSDAPIPSYNNFVNEVVFTPDGLHIAAGSSGEAARLWNIGTTDRLQLLEGEFAEKVSSVGIHPNGVLLAAGSDDTTIRVWNIDTMNIQDVLEPCAGWVNALSFSPDGSILASGSMDGTIVFWDVNTGSELRRFDNQNRCVNSMQFSPDGSRIVTGSDDEMIRLWTVMDPSGVPDQILDGEGQGINCVKFSPDGGRILFGSDDSLMKLLDLSNGECLTFRGHSMKVTTVAFCPRSQTVLSGSEDRTIRIWDASNGDPVRILRDHVKGVNAFAFSPTGLSFASSSFDDEMRIWNTETWKSRVLPSRPERRTDSPIPTDFDLCQI